MTNKPASDALAEAGHDMVARDMIINQARGLDPSAELEEMIAALARYDAEADVRAAERGVVETAVAWRTTLDKHRFTNAEKFSQSVVKLLAAREKKGTP